MPTLHNIQAEALRLRAQNDWPELTPELRFVYLVEEVGEVARALQARPGEPDRVSDAIGEELYDVIWNVCDLANILGVDLETAASRKAAMNRNRTWAP